MSTNLRNQCGFSLLEALIAIVLAAILSLLSAQLSTAFDLRDRDMFVRMNALDLAQSVMEELLSCSSEDARLKEGTRTLNYNDQLIEATPPTNYKVTITLQANQPAAGSSSIEVVAATTSDSPVSVKLLGYRNFVATP